MNGRYPIYAGFTDDVSPHQVVRNYLMDVVASRQLGAAVEPLPDSVADHLTWCASCRSWLAEIEALAVDAFGDELPAAPAYPTPDLSFLAPPAESRLLTALLDTFGRFVISFPTSFLGTLSQPTVAGALRGQFVFRQQFKLPDAPGVVVEVELTGNHTAPVASLRIGCELLYCDPLAQAGSRIVVRTGAGEWQGLTDTTGSVLFDNVPLAALPSAQIEVTPEHQADDQGRRSS